MKKKCASKYPSGGMLNYQNGYKGFGVGPQYYTDNQYFRTAMPDNIENIDERINSPSFMGGLSDGVSSANRGLNNLLGMAQQFKGMFGNNSDTPYVGEFQQRIPNNFTQDVTAIPSILGGSTEMNLPTSQMWNTGKFTFDGGGYIPKMYNGTGRQSLAMFGDSYGGYNSQPHRFNSNNNRLGAGVYTNANTNDWMHTKLSHDKQKFEDNKVDWGFMDWAKEPTSFLVGNIANSPLGSLTGLDKTFNESYMGRTTGGKLGSGLGKTTTGAMKTGIGVVRTMGGDLGGVQMIGDGIGDVGQGTVGTYGNINADINMNDYNKEGYIDWKRTQKDMDYFNQMTGELGGMFGNVYGQGKGMGMFAQGGVVDGIPIQAEKYQGQPEQIVTPDGMIQSTNAQTSHENMGNNTVTDQLPEGSHIQSSRNSLNMEEIDSLLRNIDPEQAKIVKSKLDQVYKDKYGNKKNEEISPSDITEFAKKKYQKDSTPNSFDSDKLKKKNKEEFSNLGIGINELLKVGNEISNMAEGGVVRKYANGITNLPDNFDYNNIPISSIEELDNYMKLFGIDPNIKLPNYKFRDLDNTKKRYLELSKQVGDKELIDKITNLKGTEKQQLDVLDKVAGKLQNFHKLNNPELSKDFTLDTKDTRSSIPDVIKYGKDLGLNDNEINLLKKNSKVGYHTQPANVRAILDKANSNLKTAPSNIQDAFVNSRFVDNEAYYRMPEKFQFNFGDVTDMNSPQGQAYKKYLENFYNDVPVQGNYQKNAKGKYSAPVGYIKQKVDNIPDWMTVNNIESPYNKGTYSNPGAGYGNISVMPYTDVQEKTLDNTKVENLNSYNPSPINSYQGQRDPRFFQGLMDKQLQTGLQGNNEMLNQLLSQSPLYYMETPDTYIKSRVNELPVDNILYNIERTARNTNQFLRDNTSDWSTLAGNTLNNAANMYNKVGDQLSAINEKNVGLYNTTQGLEQGLLENNMTVRNRNLGNMQEMVNKKKEWLGDFAIKNADKYNTYYNQMSDNVQREDNQKLQMAMLKATSPDAFKSEFGSNIYNQIMDRNSVYDNQFQNMPILDMLQGNSQSNLGTFFNIFNKKKK